MYRKHSFLQTIFRQWKVVILVGLIGACIATGGSLLFPFEYRADAQVFIISQSRFGVDPYTVIRSAEQIGENIAQVVKTGDFYDRVLRQPGFAIDESRFRGVSERIKRKRWQKAVNASVVFGTGVLNISGYHEDPLQAKELTSAVAATLVSQASEYVGGDVTFKVINSSVSTRFPARPNLILNVMLGFLLGVCLMSLLLLRRR